jgi:hypothetical protein
MHNGYLQYYKPKVIIGLVVVLAVLIFLAKDYWQLSISIIGIITLILFFIDQWLWKKKLFSLMFWTDNFSGRYEGFIEYEYRDENCEIRTGKLKHVKVIHQKGSKITVFSFTIKQDGNPSSVSENKGMHVELLNGEKHYQLTYSYLNGGNLEHKFPLHYGTDIIKFIKKGNNKIITGRYFTERLPFPTKGKYTDLNWVSNNQEHDF